MVTPSSLTQKVASSNNTFNCNFCHRIHWIQWTHLGKTQLSWYESSTKFKVNMSPINWPKIRTQRSTSIKLMSGSYCQKFQFCQRNKTTNYFGCKLQTEILRRERNKRKIQAESSTKFKVNMSPINWPKSGHSVVLQSNWCRAHIVRSFSFAKGTKLQTTLAANFKRKYFAGKEIKEKYKQAFSDRRFS